MGFPSAQTEHVSLNFKSSSFRAFCLSNSIICYVFHSWHLSLNIFISSANVFVTPPDALYKPSHPSKCCREFFMLSSLAPFFPTKGILIHFIKAKKKKVGAETPLFNDCSKRMEKGNEGECQSFSFTSIRVDCARLSAMKNTEKKRTEAEKKWNIYSAIKAGIWWRIMKLLPLLQTAGGGDGTHIFLIFIMMLCWWEICDA